MKGAEIIALPQVFPLPFLPHTDQADHASGDKFKPVQHSKKKEADTMSSTPTIPCLNLKHNISARRFTKMASARSAAADQHQE